MIIKNNFNLFKKDFQSDTGLKADEQLGLYIQYFNARVNDINAQISAEILNNINVKIDQLPNNIRLSISEMLRTHEVIKQIIEK
jgi:arginyl-tRNA synthetase